MNKYVRRESAANMFNRFYHMYDHLPIKALILDMKQAFFELPTEDMMQVVSCKYCARELKELEYDQQKETCPANL